MSSPFFGPLTPVVISGGTSVTEQTTTATGTEDDFDLDGSNTLLRCNNATDLTFTGFTVNGSAPSAGDLVTIVSIGAGNVYFAHEDAGSVAANRLINSISGAPTPIAAGVGIIQYQYDGTTDRWRLITHYQGAAIVVPYAAGDYTASGAMTWTVDSGDRLDYSYTFRGKNVLISINIDGSVVGGVASSALRVTFPTGLTPSATQVGPAVGADNGTASFVNYRAPSASTFLEFRRTDGANWTLSPVNGTNVIMNSEIAMS